MFGLPSKHAKAWLAAYDRLDASLVAAGWPPTSPWWRAELERFIRSGKRRWVIRVGRRGGKSSTLCRVAICQGIAGGWSIPPGDTAIVAFTSLDRDEAGSRLRTIDQALSALGIPHETTGDEISIPERRLVFRVATCSVRSVGFTSVMLVGDEMSRWESRDTAANPAKEVMASLRPTMATIPTGFEVCCSSPWSTEDYHAELFDQGDTKQQVTSFAPTWLANPTVTEEQTHDLEPDDRIWSREYAAIPGGTLSAALDPEDVAPAFELPPSPQTGRAFCAIDASSLRSDSFAWITGYESANGLCITSVNEISGSAMRAASMEDVAKRVSADAKKAGTDVVYGDQREAAGLKSLFGQQGVELITFAWSETSKQAAFSVLRTALRNRKLSICEHTTLKKQMTQCQAHLMPSGRTQYRTNGLDHLSALVTLMHAAVEHRIALDADSDADNFLRPQAMRDLMKAFGLNDDVIPKPEQSQDSPGLTLYHSITEGM